MTWQFVIAGAAVGVLVGMTGMGGGSLMTPMLILIFGFDAIADGLAPIEETAVQRFEEADLRRGVADVDFDRRGVAGLLRIGDSQ